MCDKNEQCVYFELLKRYKIYTIMVFADFGVLIFVVLTKGDKRLLCKRGGHVIIHAAPAPVAIAVYLNKSEVSYLFYVLQPSSGEAGQLHAFNYVFILTHGFPYMPRLVIVDHQYDRALVKPKLPW